jgi:Domain of unknown function (DUF4148)
MTGGDAQSVQPYDRSNTMKRTLIAGLLLSAVSAFAATSAFADGGIGHAGTYNESWGTSTKTRAEVRAEIVEAYNNGTLPELNRTTYPDVGLVGRAIAMRSAQPGDTRLAHQATANAQFAE